MLEEHTEEYEQKMEVYRVTLQRWKAWKKSPGPVSNPNRAALEDRGIWEEAAWGRRRETGQADWGPTALLCLLLALLLGSKG